MNLNEQISKIKSIMGLQPINEYVTQHEVYLDDVVSWVMRNYDRYKSVIHYEPTRSNKPNNYD